MRISIHKCRFCQEIFENQAVGGITTMMGGAKHPNCPKCGKGYCPSVEIRYTCDYSECGESKDHVPDLWIGLSMAVSQWQAATHWEGASVVRGDIRGNVNAGAFTSYPTSPYDLVFCSLIHAKLGMLERWNELEAVDRKWAQMRGV